MNRRTSRSAWRYFLLTITLSLPFWLAGALVDVQLLPGLPLSALGVACPVAAASILSFRESRAGGMKDLLKRCFDFGRVKSKAWYLPAILLMPLISLAAYGAMRVIGTPLPPLEIPVARSIALFLGFLAGGLCEEVGWSGYAVDPLQDQLGAFMAAMAVGVVWAAWHFIPLAEAHRSLGFVAWWTVNTIAMRVVIVWLYNNTGRSVFMAALLHAMSNLTWQLFPVNGSFYDPRVTAPITALVAVLVVAVWGPRTFTRRSL